MNNRLNSPYLGRCSSGRALAFGPSLDMLPSSESSLSSGVAVRTNDAEAPDDRWDATLNETVAVDLVVRSSDGILFGTSKARLRVASAVMEDMLSIGEPSSKRRKLTRLPVVDLPEDSCLLADFLLSADRSRLADAVERISWGSVEEIGEALDVADKVRLYHSALHAWAY